ncbi:MAG: NAD(P)H-dependent oxidoreductase [Acidobacteriota bacterium]
MSKYRISVVVGSLRKDSFNRKLADGIIKLAPDEFEFKHLSIGDLPLYNQDDDLNPSDQVRNFKSEILASDGVLFVTPEYNRSIPGVLKNALDQASRPYGESVWAGKPAGILGVTIGTVGTAAAQQHLRCILAYLDMPTLGQPEAFLTANANLFDENGNIADSSKQFLKGWMDRYCDWVRKHAE